SDGRAAVDERQTGSGSAADLPTESERDPKVAREPERRRESEAGRILASVADRRERNSDERGDARSEDDRHGSARWVNEAGGPHTAEPRAARWSDAQAAEPDSEVGRVLREQREREALDRGWGIE